MKDFKKAYKTLMDDNFPEDMSITFGGQRLTYKKRTWKIDEQGEQIEKGLRYGENPGQEAALYEPVNGNLVLGSCTYIGPGNSLVSGIDENSMIQFGKHPGKINLTDIDSALNILKFLSYDPAAVVVKHNNPCGVAMGSGIAEAFSRAYQADRIAAFGGCVALNRKVDKETAELISAQYLEVVAAPDYSGDAVEILKTKKNLRIVKIERIDRLEQFRDLMFLDFKSLIDGGLIVQQSPRCLIRSSEDLVPARCEYKGEEFKIDRLPTEKEYQDLLFGWYVEQGVTSNSVLFTKDRATTGIGTGEQDRVGVAEIAIRKAYTKYSDLLCFKKYAIPLKQMEREVESGERPHEELMEIYQETEDRCGGLTGSVAVSDAFFPFRDAVDVIIKEGITAIIQPGGSIRDFESIQACNEHDPKIAMVFTGQRAFKH